LKFLLCILVLVIITACGDWDEVNEHDSEKDYINSLTDKENKSLFISGEVNLSQIRNIESYTHLVFEEDSILITEDNDLHLNLIELVSDNGSIVTFRENSLAENNFAGLNGGKIKIFTKKAIGNLHVILQGQNAGERTDEPAPLGKKYQGKKGARGHSAKVECFDPPDLRMLKHSMSFRGFCHCVRNAGNGGRGGQGAKGTRGFKGLQGGDTGSFEINISDGENFEITYSRFEGLGGSGSIGGIGGPGGQGGNPGKNQNGCKKGKRGPTGLQGERGVRGPRGDNGNLGKICLKLSKHSAKYCF